MSRFYISRVIAGDTVSIKDAGQLHHLRYVLRLRIGDTVTVFDSVGNEFSGIISKMDKKQVDLTLQERKMTRPKRIRIAIACAIPKKSRMDDIIDKLTQLGVDTIIPVQTKRGIVKLEEKEASRLERWRKIALSASEQSRRNSLPEITSVMGLEEVLKYSQTYDLKLIPTLEGAGEKLSQVIPAVTGDLSTASPASILVLIGPEGDFTPEEAGMAVRAGAIPVSLGDSVLRVETAAIAIAAYIIFSFMD